MKKLNNIALITMAFVMAFAIVVPVFAATSTSVSQNPFENEIVDIDEIVENDVIVENVESESDHVCTITKANANRHIVDCDCGTYEYVHHADLAASAKSEFFHEFECSCGYSYSEVHDFATAYDQNGHQDICIDCGYAKPQEAHVFVDEYYGSYHDIQCECGYIAAHHVGVTFETIDAGTCSANCRQCGITEIVDHSFKGFCCRNCNFVVDGITYAIVDDILEYDDGTYSIRFMSNGNSHRVTMESVNFNEGDFVKINHYGDEIFEVSVMVDNGIIDAPKAFPYYIHSDLIVERNEVVFENIVIDEITNFDTNVSIIFQSRTRSMGVKNYVVYDMMNCEMSDLKVGYAYLTFFAGDTVYFICIW